MSKSRGGTFRKIERNAELRTSRSLQNVTGCGGVRHDEVIGRVKDLFGVAMFGLSKRERYEREVRANLSAMFGAGSDGDDLAAGITQRYAEHWPGVIREGLELGNSADLTAAVISAIFYRDIIKAEASPDVVAEAKHAILDQVYESENGLLTRLTFTTLFVSSKAAKLTADQKALWVRDIHRAIFDDDDLHVDTTITYLFGRADRLRAEFESLKTNRETHER